MASRDPASPGTPGTRAGRRPTMADVAARAGVSRTLVSFILDGKPGAGAATRERVLAIADELGYRPDSAARLLAQGRSRTIGVLMDVHQLFQSELVANIYPAAEELGHDVLLSANLPDHPEEGFIEALLSHRCGALILLGAQSPVDYLQSLSRRAPVVVVGRRLPAEFIGGGLSTVRTDDAVGIRLAVDYLADLGHRDIIHVDGGIAPGAADRRTAYEQAMRARGLADEIGVVPGDHTEASGTAAARAIMARPVLPTAVLAGNGRCALGLFDGFTRAGIAVPEQISLMGYDDSRLSDNPLVDLSTVHQDARELARRAVRLAVDLLDDPEYEGDDIVLQPSLRIRGATAVPRAR